jgi:hypothetical protein
LTGGRPFGRGLERRVHRRRSHVRCHPRRCLVGPVRAPFASSSKSVARQSKTPGHGPARGADRSPASSPSAAGAAPGSPGPVLDVHEVPTPASDRRRSIAGAYPDTGWRGRHNQLGGVLTRVTASEACQRTRYPWNMGVCPVTEARGAALCGWSVYFNSLPSRARLAIGPSSSGFSFETRRLTRVRTEP